MSRIFLFIFASIIATAAPGETVLVVGDSLSAAYGIFPQDGWVHQLRRRLKALDDEHQVINTSISGETTAGGLTRIGALLNRHHPTIVIIELGGNDGLRGVPISSIRTNLASMIDLSLANNVAVVLLGMRLPSNYGPQYTNRFKSLFTKLASTRKIAFVPFFLEGVADSPALMQADGIHPNSAAQTRLLNNVWPALIERLGNQGQ